MKFSGVNALLLLSLLAGLCAGVFTGIGCMSDPFSVGQPDSLFSEFVLVWDLVDRNYACFCHKSADWDRIYTERRSVAMSLTDRDEMIDLALDMLGELHDVHLVISDSSGARMDSWDPGFSPNWNMEVWQAYMEEWGCPTSLNTYGVSPLAAPMDSIGYVFISTLGSDFDWMAFFGATFGIQQCSCLIVDLRMCSGSGIESNATYTMGRFTSDRILAYYRAFRVGPGRCDMGEMQEIYPTQNGAWQFTGPTVVLTGRDTQGAAEQLTMLFATQDNITIIGNTTCGYANVSLDYNLLDDWTVSIPFMMTYSTDTTPILGNGVVPEVYVQATEEDFQSGVDPVLDAALEMLM